MSHCPVLLSETMDILSPKDGDRVLDCTFGGGGHTKAILERANCYVCGIDRDPDARERSKDIKSFYKDSFDFIQGNFSDISNLLQYCDKFDAVMFDFGISSFQVDEAARGFSFNKDAPLDMRMSKEGLSAYDVVNSFSEDEIAEIIWTYGDESKSRRIAADIVNYRKNSKIITTMQLADIVRKSVGYSIFNKKNSNIDSATKTFQAIRIFVNDELRAISEALKQLPNILNDKARIATISFHSLEDKIVKNWYQNQEKSRGKAFEKVNGGVIKPTSEEIQKNPRSRSAILRGFLYNKITKEDQKERS